MPGGSRWDLGGSHGGGGGLPTGLPLVCMHRSGVPGRDVGSGQSQKQGSGRDQWAGLQREERDESPGRPQLSGGEEGKLSTDTEGEDLRGQRTKAT